MQRIGGSRRKSRHKLSRPSRSKGKLTLTRYFQTLSIGERVCLKVSPNFNEGIYHMRFHGLSGVVVGKSGRYCKVRIKDGNKHKEFIVHPVHLIKLQGV